MKKSLLFVIDSLDTAGAEKSLVSLLGLLDYSKYDVDLQLFAHGYPLEELVPKQVRVLEPLRYSRFSNLEVGNSMLYAIKHHEYRMLYSRLVYSAKLRSRNYSNPQKARLYWQSISKVIDESKKTYDIAISYAQGVPTFYVASKVKAKKKYAWVNVSYKLDEKEKSFQKDYYNQFDKVIAVSDSTRDVFVQTYPEYKTKMEVIYDINNPQLINNLANNGEGYHDSFDGIRILTIGRLAYQKGYDVALETCRLLKEKGLNFRWYVLGKGPLKEEIEEEIKSKDLTNHFILLGVTSNPYPLIKQSDIYVQTSRFEGFGLAIAEARLLNTPVVTTEFDAVFNQMIHGKNGIVVKRDAKNVCNALFELISNVRLRNQIIKFLTKEKKGNIEEVEKFYQLIG
ncbi:glycosyltransferase [Ornithinibacillus californiensis]|uniref:glycosyltransferase n=1 Tax=Ornithinibacillus californiensis TaxID=161536 RepID=UPI00064D75D1|nr:glycosyltransferase [Ornithinibacillus californiensis]